MGTKGFDKFIHKPLAGAKKKEALRQQKRQAKQAARERGEEEKQRRREADIRRGRGVNDWKTLKEESKSDYQRKVDSIRRFADDPKANSDRKSTYEKKPSYYSKGRDGERYDRNSNRGNSSFDRKPNNYRKDQDGEGYNGDRKSTYEKKPSYYSKGGDGERYDRNSNRGDSSFDRKPNNYRKDQDGEGYNGDRKSTYEKKPSYYSKGRDGERYDRNSNRGNSSFDRKPNNYRKDQDGEDFNGDRKSYYSKNRDENRFDRNVDQRSSYKRDSEDRGFEQKPVYRSQREDNRDYRAKKSTFNPATIENKESGEMPLNKFLAHCGVCARREAINYIKAGSVKVNGEVQTEPGFKVDSKNDIVLFKGRKLYIQKNLVYVLLNKPKDTLTTMDDPQGRRTVYDYIKNVTEERVFPVGRLDRNTTGVLLLTNDGELTQKLTHPKFQIQKIYEARLDKDLTKKDSEAIVNGITLEDGFINADAIGFPDPKDKSIVGIEIHSGRNRIVRRIFESLGYEVKNLDRVLFAGLTKKNVERSHWRYLSEKEVRILKFLNKSLLKEKKETKA